MRNKLIIGEEITYIGNNASDTYHLKEAQIAGSVKRIGSGASAFRDFDPIVLPETAKQSASVCL